MIFIDDRTGSAELAPVIRSLGCPVSVMRLGYGDVMFIGNGPQGVQWPVGIERKTIGDLLASIRSGRAATQVDGMRNSYYVVYLVVEGLMKADGSGKLLVWRGHEWQPSGMEYTAVVNFLNTLAILADVKLIRTTSLSETGQTVVALWHWWTDKAWEDHRSHLVPIQKPITFRPPSLLRRVAAELPNVSWKRSKAIEEHFRSVKEMVNAPIEDWKAIDGIGEKIAQRIVSALNAESDTSGI